MNRLRSIAVTGSSGRVGSAICTVARSQGLNVIGLDIRPDSRSVKADITDQEQLAHWFDGADCVFHCAGLHAPHVDVASVDAFQAINVGGTANVLGAIKQTGVPRLVLTSSTAVFGGGSEPDLPARWIDENTSAVSRTIYHATKLEAELQVRSATSADLKASIVRLGRCFDEGPRLTAFYRLSRGISVRDAAIAHFCAAMACDLDCKPLIACAPTPFERGDVSVLGYDARSVIEHRCPGLMDIFAKHGWEVPPRLDRVYDSTAAQGLWDWTPKDDINAFIEAFS